MYIWIKESGFKSSVTTGLSLILLTEQEDSGWQEEHSYTPAGGGGPAGHLTGRAPGGWPATPTVSSTARKHAPRGRGLPLWPSLSWPAGVQPRAPARHGVQTSRRWLIPAVQGSLTPWKPANAVRQGSSSSRRAGCRTFTSPLLCPAIHLPPVSPFPGQPSIPSSHHREMDPSGKGPVEPGRCRASADRRTQRPRQNPARVCGFFLHLFTAISFRPKWM